MTPPPASSAAEFYDDGDPVNLGADRELPIRDLVGIIVELVGFKGEVRWDTSKPDGQPRRGVDGSRARERFGFVAETSFDEGLAKTLAWYLENREEAEARPV
jgi:nucleoside-diphosphate-sugar epimerase